MYPTVFCTCVYIDGWMASLTQWTRVGWTLGVGDGQGGLACCSSWGRKELDTTERLNWTDMCICAYTCMYVCVCVCGVFSSSIDIFYGCTSQMTIAQLPPMMSIWPMGNLPWAPQIEVEISYPQGIPDPLPVISLQLPFLLQRHRGRSAIPLSWS